MTTKDDNATDQRSSESGSSTCSLTGTKSRVYGDRKKAKQLRNSVRDELMSIAHTREPAIKEFVNLVHRNSRGHFDGVSWNDITMRVDARWNFYEGHGYREFPQGLLWSDAELLAIKGLTKEQDKDQKEAEKAWEIAKRDELLAKHPVQ